MNSPGKIHPNKKELPDSAMSMEFVRQFKPQEKILPTKEINIFTPLQAGMEIDSFEIIDELGQGGMGAVYRARDTRSQRIVALKVMKETDATAQKRFDREARAMARLKHPHIIEVYQVGKSGDKAYFSMPCIEGVSLSHVVKQKLALQEAVKIVIKIAQALHYAHSKGVIHRDLKPENIILSHKDHPYIMDFGLAKVTDETMTMTRTGDVVGTIQYMAPEQAAGKIAEIDERSDIYSLGAILYKMLTGRVPIAGDNVLQLAYKISNTSPEPLCKIDPNIPPALEQICLKALAKDPRKRYQSAQKMALALAQWLRRGQRKHKSTFSNTKTHVLAIAVVLFLFASAAIFLLDETSSPKNKKNTTSKNSIVKAIPRQKPSARKNLSESTEKSQPSPSHWPMELWQQCWLEKEGYIDFTSQSWLDLPAQQQMKYASAYQQWYAQRQGKLVEKTISVNDIDIEVVLIPPGKFWMGSPPDELGRKSYEPYQKFLVQAFWMGKCELTREQWQAVVDNQPWQEQPGENPRKMFAKFYLRQQLTADVATSPTNFVSFANLQKFVASLGSKSRIPTDVQWEYACRAGVTSKFFWGNSSLNAHEYANFNDLALKNLLRSLDYTAISVLRRVDDAIVKTAEMAESDDRFALIAPVKSKKPNSFGLFDTCGNVSEWCEKSESGRKQGILRGGCWRSPVNGLRCAEFFTAVPDSYWDHYGARIAFDF